MKDTKDAFLAKFAQQKVADENFSEEDKEMFMKFFQQQEDRETLAKKT